MENINVLINNRIKYLETVILEKEKSLPKKPEDSIRISIDHKKVRYYRQKKNKENKRIEEYIPKKEINFVKELAQKQYDEQILLLAQRQRNQLIKFNAKYDDKSLQQVYTKMHSERKKLITPIESTWDEFAEQWIREEYIPKEFTDKDPYIVTNRGERVRSKSEKIIADLLYQNNIPYKYECPLHLKKYGIIYPDFTILSRKTRTVIYWEHCGRMDDPSYTSKMVTRVNCYEQNNYIVGRDLILTFETQNIPLQTSTIVKNLQLFLL